MNTKSDIAPSLFATAIRFYDFGRNSSHRNLNSGSLKVKKCPRYERPTSYHKLNFPTQNFRCTVFNICIVFGRTSTYLGHSFHTVFFTFHGLILLLDFRFLWLFLAQQISSGSFFIAKNAAKNWAEIVARSTIHFFHLNRHFRVIILLPITLSFILDCSQLNKLLP
jgi:hypothetical protein